MSRHTPYRAALPRHTQAMPIQLLQKYVQRSLPNDWPRALHTHKPTSGPCSHRLSTGIVALAQLARLPLVNSVSDGGRPKITRTNTLGRSLFVLVVTDELSRQQNTEVFC